MQYPTPNPHAAYTSCYYLCSHHPGLLVLVHRPHPNLLVVLPIFHRGLLAFSPDPTLCSQLAVLLRPHPSIHMLLPSPHLSLLAVITQQTPP